MSTFSRRFRKHLEARIRVERVLVEYGWGEEI
jgi:hypothetical protein